MEVLCLSVCVCVPMGYALDQMYLDTLNKI